MGSIKYAAAIALLQTVAATSGAAGEVAHVAIRDMAFSPAVLTVRVGDAVEWMNSDFVDHTATARNGSWDVVIASGKAARVEMTKAGTFEYFCRYHPNMVGRIEVIKPVAIK